MKDESDHESDQESQPEDEEPKQHFDIEIHNMIPQQCNCWEIEYRCDFCMLGCNAVCELCQFTLPPCDFTNKCSCDHPPDPFFHHIKHSIYHINICTGCKDLDPAVLKQRLDDHCDQRFFDFKMPASTREDWEVLEERHQAVLMYLKDTYGPHMEDMGQEAFDEWCLEYADRGYDKKYFAHL
jgi:hypothetical protein